MATVKVTQDKNGVRWLELMRNGFDILLEIRNDEEALQIINALQQSVQRTGVWVCENCQMQVPVEMDVCFACHTARR